MALGNKDPLIVQTLLQADISSLGRWCDEHIYYGATVLVINSFDNYDLLLNGNKLNYLGVQIDATLSFEVHCTRVLRSGRVKLTHLRRLKKHMDSTLALLMYKQMIVPSLEYCALIFESGPDGTCRELQNIQITARNAVWELLIHAIFTLMRFM